MDHVLAIEFNPISGLFFIVMPAQEFTLVTNKTLQSIQQDLPSICRGELINVFEDNELHRIRRELGEYLGVDV